MTLTSAETTNQTGGPTDLAPQQARQPWLLVTLREIQVKLTDRNFLISTAFTLVLLIGVMAFQALIGGGSPSYTVAVSDQAAAGVVQQAEQTLQADDEEAVLQTTEVSDRAAGEALVTEGEADAMLVRADEGWELIADGLPDGELQGVLSDTVRMQALSSNAEAAGTTVDELTAGAQVSPVDISDAEIDPIVGSIAGFIFAFLFYMASIMFGMSIATSVVEEKQSRIVEILAAVIPVRQLLVGKVVGNLLIALGQLVLIIGVSLIGLTFTEWDTLLPSIAPAVVWYIPFFLAGFLALACVWAAAGAMASRQEDLQSSTMPITILLVAVLFAGFALEGTAQQIGSYVPVLSTVVMPVRMLAGGVGWWEPVLALLLTLAFCALTIAVGTRLYRRALLQTQGRLGWKAAWSAGD